MIRHAEPSDIPFVMEMGRRFADEAGVTAEVGWDDESVERLLNQMIAHDDGLLLVGGNTILGGLAFAHPFNGAVKVFQELFWRSEGAEGVKALKMAEAWMKGRGVSRSLMLDIATMGDLSRVYERLGYRLAERTFIKEI